MVSDWIPGVRWIQHYDRGWLSSDIIAGVSVAAVALPTAVAYATLVGVEPVYGVYASILPLIIYAFFGTSRQLIVNPDSATCAMVAAAATALAAGSSESHVALCMAVTILAGVFSVLGGFLKLGFVADFLSKPILLGYLNGVALSIIVGQMGKILGFKVDARGVVLSALEIIQKVSLIHGPTISVALVTAVTILVSRRISRRIPAVLFGILIAIAVVKIFGLEAQGVSVVGHVPAGLPSFRWPGFSWDTMQELVGGAVAVALISFSSGMVTARIFASRNHYDINANQEMIAMGLSNIGAGCSQGFAVSGADSRTAVADAMGGKSQLTSIVAGVSMAAVLLFFTTPLYYLPKAALGAVLVVSAWGLIDWVTLIRLWRVTKGEFVIAMITTGSVIWLDVLKSILIAVGLSLLMLLLRMARPVCVEVARVPGLKGFHNMNIHAEARRVEGLTMLRFSDDILFFNADYLRREANQMVQRAQSKWLVLDFSGVSFVDYTGLEALRETSQAMSAKGIVFAVANVNTKIRTAMQAAGVHETIGATHDFPTLKAALKAYISSHGSLEDAAALAAHADDEQAG